MSTFLSRFAQRNGWLDAVADTMSTAWEPIFGEDGSQELKDALYGVWLGHPLHPMLTDVSIGAWTTSMLMDIAGEHRASDLALKAGTASSALTAVTGIAQWYDTTNGEQPKRLGALHASLNGAALACYITAIALREKDARQAGIATAWAGHTLATAAGFVGGHLTFDRAIGPNRDAHTDPVDDWKPTPLRAEGLPEGKPVLTQLEDETPVMLVKTAEGILASTPTCSHLGGPLPEGTISGACVTCPWHGAEFDLHTGKAIHGPATAAITVYETKVDDGVVLVRTPRADR